MNQSVASPKRSSSIDVLLVGDRAADVHLVRKALSDSTAGRFQLTTAARLTEALVRLQEREYDVVLLDFSLAGGQGFPTLQQAHAAAPCVPIVVMTGHVDEALALEAVRAGAQDYFVKGEGEFRTLSRTLAHAIQRHRMFMELKRSHEHERYLATRDPLTGLPNRHLFFDHLGRALAQADRRADSLAILFLDIDRFKSINDSLGHVAGDQLLRELAGRLSSCVRVDDAAARLGGDEFAITMSGFSGVQDVGRVAEKALHALSRPCGVENHELRVTVSIGIAVYPSDGRDCRTLIKNADTAMYAAKQQGRNAFRFYAPEMNALARDRLLLEGRMRGAMGRDEFLVYYQPEVSVGSGEIVGAEALLRWRLPGQGVLSPARFLPLAEETGLIVPMSEWVLRKACGQNMAWRKAGYPPIRVAVNLSPRQLKQNDLVRTVERTLDESGLDAGSLQLDLPEGRLAAGAGLDPGTLAGLDGTGVRLAVDDFGTGYSSFGALESMPFDALKIDRSFVQGATSGAHGGAITAAMIGLGDALGLENIAEGVETPEQLEFLRAHNCSQMQGYLVSRPVPAERFEGLWAQNRRASSRLFRGVPSGDEST